MRRRTESRARRRQSTRMQTELHGQTQCRYEPTTISGNTNPSFVPLLEIKSPQKQTRPSIMVSSRAMGGRRKINRGAPPTTQERPPPWNASNTKGRHILWNQTKFRSLPLGIDGSFTPRRVPIAQLENRTNTHALRESPTIAAPRKRPEARHIRTLFGARY